MLDELYHAIDPIAFQIGQFAVKWYGLGYIFGIFIGIFILYRIAQRWNIKFSLESLLTIIIASMIGIIFGARLGYILFYDLSYYIAHPLEIFVFTGMSFHGGLLGMVAAVAVCAKILKIPLLTLGDLVVIAAPVGIFLVRIANFINGELWGAPTDLPWGVVFDIAGSMPRHPSQLYEAFLEGVVIFVALFILSRRTPPRPRGFFSGMFMVLYGVFRIAIEFVREPDAHIGYLFGTGWLTMGIVLSIPLLLAGIVFLVFACRTRLPQQGMRQDIQQGLQSGLLEGAQGNVREDAQEGSQEDAGEEAVENPVGDSASDAEDADEKATDDSAPDERDAGDENAGDEDVAEKDVT